MKLKRKEIPAIINGLSQVKGLKDFKKAISLGRDLRLLKSVQEETEAAIKAATPENYEALAEELRELKAKKAKEFELKEGELLNEQALTAHVVLLWPKSKQFHESNRTYNESVEAIYNEQVEMDIHTELTDKDLPKCAEDVNIAEVLTYFMK